MARLPGLYRHVAVLSPTIPADWLRIVLKVTRLQAFPPCPDFWKSIKHMSQDRTGTKNEMKLQWLVLGAGSVRYLPRGPGEYGDTWGDMGALSDGARVDATGLACVRSHALWPWPDQEARQGKNMV